MICRTTYWMHIIFYISILFLLLCICTALEMNKSKSKLILLQLDDCRKDTELRDVIKMRFDPGSITSLLDLETFIRREIGSLNEKLYSVTTEVYDKSNAKFIPLKHENQLIQLLNTKSVDRLLSKIRSIGDSHDDLPLLKGKTYDISEGFTVDNTLIRIESPGEAHLGTGLTVWDGSCVLAKYLECYPEVVRGKQVLEVGAGTGISGIAAALLGAHSVYITDLAYTLENLRRNVEHNVPPGTAQQSVAVQELDWSDPNTYPEIEWDVILGADVVWLEHLVPSLVACLERTATMTAKVLIAHQSRSRYTDDLFFSSMQRLFDMEQVNLGDLQSTLPQNVKIWQFLRKPAPR